MLCLKAEALGHDMYSSPGVILPVNIGRSIQKVMQKVGKNRGDESQFRRSDPSSCSSGEGSASCSGVDDAKNNDGAREGRRRKKSYYKSQLQQEVQRLQQQLQTETDLHVALANAVTHNAHDAGPLLNSPSRLPDQARQLLDNIATLEITVSKLEEELASLQLQLCQERHERNLAENHLGCLLSQSPERPSKSSTCMWEEHISSLRVSKFGLNQMPSSLQQDLSSNGDLELATEDTLLDEFPHEELLGSCSKVQEEIGMDTCFQQSDAEELKNDLLDTNPWNHPNHLSEEMVRCMRNIFLRLSESSDISSKASSSEYLPSPSSPVGRLSSTFTSFSDSSFIPSNSQNPSTGTHENHEVVDPVDAFDPYGVNGKVNWRNIGCYSLASEVSWMSVGKAQLEYAADALKGYRFLVEQLAKINPASMNDNERLAFWINVYNALIMHAYLAYGVPRSDTKLFSLMQKASYIVGGQSFSAAEIEFVILKMKPPAHRPQLALVLALHKFKISEVHKKYSIDSPEPLTLFALSCGMYSSPAIRVFTADNIQDELQNSMRDYIRASIGISEKGKLLVPKLLHCFAKSIVEDSLLIDWICRYLSPEQVTIVRDSTSQRKQRLLGVRSFSVIPFDSRFRYLFLPDDKTSQKFSL
ncbi:hypothetical protein Cni_G00773 [Canna indica]|uniref:Uncharacterized protein n=1 Tax=Canna indica TaxID=4628 RepID=A0AAQ3JLX6_9LILI|nr:hypothetical protein Cni_G00773 [Canna indica]